MFDTFWHKILRHPYQLARAVDEGHGVPVVLLHGIGRSGRVWQYVVGELASRGQSFRVVAFDLLGFGNSPSPDWAAYSVDDHARAVIASIEKLRLKQPVLLVGHSMGSLVAVRVATLRPDLVRHLVLYEMPLHHGLPETLSYRSRLELYTRLYKWVSKYPLSFNAETAKRTDWLTRRIVGVDVDQDSWLPYVRSLENTIIKQRTSQDLKRLKVSMDIIYGSFDLLVVRGKEKHLFGTDLPNATLHTVKAKHAISKRASRYIADRLVAALEAPDYGD